MKKTKITKNEIIEADKILKKYKEGKSALERKIVENEQFFKARHWDAIRNKMAGSGKNRPEPTSGWLFNIIASKHADAMDNIPEAVVLPREADDCDEAKMLSQVLPVILENRNFEQTYSDVWWYKLKNGTGAYGVFWNGELENGVGDIDIKKLDLLNIFWEPGINNIQDSQNLFITSLVDDKVLKISYPNQLKDIANSKSFDVTQYVHDDRVDTNGKSLVVDWYYKEKIGGRTVLQYVKYINDVVLYASKDTDEYCERGFYDHGMYPIVFDVLFPEEGSPAGFSFIDVCKDNQVYIDKLNQIMLDNTLKASKIRYFIKGQNELDEDEFADFSKDFVHVSGNSLGEENIRQIVVNPVVGGAMEIMSQKINEMKEVASTRDFTSGGTMGGVTAASAIIALQEAGSKNSRDMIKNSYRAYSNIINLIIENIRQFYDVGRSFRITGADLKDDFVRFSNEKLRIKPDEAFSGPVFDLKVKAQKTNPYSRLEQNELAKELYMGGFFDPNRAEQALTALELMNFEGKETVVAKIKEQIANSMPAPGTPPLPPMYSEMSTQDDTPFIQPYPSDIPLMPFDIGERKDSLI